MTLRWRLNLSVLALMAVFLTAAAFTVQAVRQNAEETRIFLRMREASQFTADLRTHLYQQLARLSAESAPAGDDAHWADSSLDDVDIQIRQSLDSHEKELWRQVHDRLAALSRPARQGSGDIAALVEQVDQQLHELRNFYDLSEYHAAVRTADGSFRAQAAISFACVLTVLLFLIYLVIVRRWLIRPIHVLQGAAQTIGQGHLDHRVPLRGSDELSNLARSIDAMAEGLARYQSDLVRSRELSALGEFCANVAHGLRNPLAAIRSTAQLAERRGASEEQRQVFRDVSAQADRMDHRITTLFQFSRPIDLQCGQSRFGQIAASAQAQARPLLQSRQMRVEIEDATGDRTFEVDPEQLAQALAELLTNAAHHSPQGARVRVRGETAAGEKGVLLLITVEDEGSGMSASTAQKAFDLFFTSRPEGTGIGLALVRRIAERHDGDVSIDSKPGSGTRVTLRIPAGPPASPPTNGRSARA